MHSENISPYRRRRRLNYNRFFAHFYKYLSTSDGVTIEVAGTIAM